MQILENCDSFINRLFRTFIITALKKYFQLSNRQDFVFEQTNPKTYNLNVENLAFKQTLFSETFLPFQLKFSHIDSLSLSCNTQDSLDLNINLKGVYLQLKFLEEEGKGDMELQERLRWIGYLFRAASDIFNESGKKFLKRKLKMILNDKLWDKIQVKIEEMIIWIEMPDKSCLGLCGHQLGLQNNIIQTKNLQEDGKYAVCKDIIMENLVFFHYEQDPLLAKPSMNNQEIKKILSETIKTLTYYNQFESQMHKKLVAGALNLPLNLEVSIILSKKRTEVLTSKWEILVKVGKLTFNISPEKLFLVKDLVLKVIKPFEIYYKIVKAMHQYDDFHPDILSNAEKITGIALKYPAIRAKVQEKYRKKNPFMSVLGGTLSEIISVEDIKEAFDSPKEFSEFRNLLLTTDFDTLFAAIKNSFLLTSKAANVAEKSLRSVFLFDIITGNDRVKFAEQDALYETLLKWYTGFVGKNEFLHQEEAILEQSSIDIKVLVSRLVILTAEGPNNEKKLEIELNELMMHQTLKNWLGFGTVMLVKSGKVEARLEILSRLGLMKRGKIKDVDSLRNLLKWDFVGLKYEIQVEALKRADLSSLMLEIKEMKMIEEVYAKNYRSYPILLQLKEKNQENPAMNLYMDYMKEEGQYLIKEGELELYGLKIYDMERLFAYFDAVLERIPSFMCETKIKFPKETKIAVRSEKTYVKISNKRPYYQTLGSFLIEKSDDDDEESLNLETVVADRKLLYEVEENKYIEISSGFEAVIEIKLAMDLSIIRVFHSHIKIVFNTRNLLHFFDETRGSDDRSEFYLPIPSQLGVENYFEKLTFIWIPFQPEAKPGVSSLIFQLENVQFFNYHTVENSKWQLTLDKLEISQIEYYNSKTCISRRIFGDFVEPIYLPNTDFSLLSSLGVSQSMTRSSKQMMESSKACKAIEISFMTAGRGKSHYTVKLLNPKLLVSFPLIYRLQSSHNLFHVLKMLIGEHFKQFSASEIKISLKDFHLYIPSTIKDESQKCVILKGDLEYSPFSEVRSPSYREYKAKFSNIELMISSMSDLTKGIFSKARKILSGISVDLEIGKQQTLEEMDEYNTLIKNAYKLSLDKLDLSSKITLNDLLFLQQIFNKEMKTYEELNSHHNPLTQLLISTLNASTGLKDRHVVFHVENSFNLDLKNLQISLVILSDMDRNNFPALDLSFNIAQWIRTGLSTLLKGRLSVHFNSLVSQTWEPIIEPFYFILTQRKIPGEFLSAFTLDSSQSPSGLLLNLTEEFLDFMMKTYLFYQSKKTQQQNLPLEQSQSFHAYEISPYIAQNLCDLDIEIHYQGTIVKTSNGSKQFITKKDFHQDNIELDIKARGPRDQQYFNIGTVDPDKTHKIEVFPLYFLKHQPGQFEPRVLVKCEKQGYYTTITFLTPFAIENNLPYPVRISFGKTNPQTGQTQSYREYTINPGKYQSIPVGLYPVDEFFLALEPQFIAKENLWSLFAMQNNSFKTLRSTSGNSLFSLRKYRKEGQSGVTFMSIEFTLVIQNLVPLPVIINLTENGQKVVQKTLAPNNQQAFHQIKDPEAVKIALMLPNSFWSDEDKLMLTPGFLTQESQKMAFGKNFTKTLYIKDQNDFPVPLKLTYQKNNPNHIFISVDNLLVDKLAANDVQYYQETSGGKYFGVNIGQRGVLKAYSKNQYGIFLIDTKWPLKISKQNGEVIVDLKSIENVREIKLQTKREPEDLLNFPLTVQVGENILNKEAQITMKTYTINPTFSFHNKTSTSLVLQSGLKTKMLNPGEFTALDCFKNNEEDMISLKQIFNSKEMSNKTSELNIKELSSLNLAFRNTKAQLCGLINVRKLNVKDRVQIIASDQIMEHLYLIENKLPAGIDLLITQKGASNAYSYYVKSGTKVPFAWDFPLKPKEIIVVPANPNLRMAESTFNFHENCGTSLKDESGKVMLVEARLEFAPNANLLLSFRVVQKNLQGNNEEIEVFDKGNKIQVRTKGEDQIANKWYIQIQRVNISMIGMVMNQKREEILRLVLDGLQIEKNDVLWNVSLGDIGFYKLKSNELWRLDVKKNQNNEPLGLNMVLLMEKDVGDIARIIKLLVIKSNSLSRMAVVLEEVLKFCETLTKKSEEDSIYGMKKASSISHSILNLTQAIANKRKLAIENCYLLQQDLGENADSPPILKKLFSYTSDSPATEVLKKYIPIKMKNMRVGENEAIGEIAREIIMAGKAFVGGKKSVADFVNSRAFFAEVLDIQQDLVLKIGNDEGKSLLEGFGIEGMKDLNRMLSHIDDDILGLKAFGSEGLEEENVSRSLELSVPVIRKSMKTIIDDQNPLKDLHYSIINGITHTRQNSQGEYILPMVCQVKVLYGKERALKIQKEEDMERLNVLQKVVGMGYKELSNLSYFGSVGFIMEGERYFVIFTGEFVFYCNESKKKLIWHIKSKLIKDWNFASASGPGSGPGPGSDDKKLINLLYLSDDKKEMKKVVLPIEVIQEEKRLFEKTLRFYIESANSL